MPEFFRAAAERVGRADAEWLLAHVLGCGRMEARLAHPSEEEWRRFAALVARRENGEPLQYILGVAGFYGRDFAVEPGVLIPRMDTEALAERALCLLDGAINPRVADICTGSGILAITIALERPDASVFATDISPDALRVAQQNAERLGAHVRFSQGDLLAPLQGRFALLISNPPYIPGREIDALAEEVRREPRLALDGGEDGLDFYRILAKKAPDYLLKDGALALEIGDGQAAEVCGLLRENGFAEIAVAKDLSGLDRVVTGRNTLVR